MSQTLSGKVESCGKLDLYMLIYENRLSKWNFFVSRISFHDFRLKIGVKRNLKIIAQNHAYDPEKG